MSSIKRDSTLCNSLVCENFLYVFKAARRAARAADSAASPGPPLELQAGRAQRRSAGAIEQQIGAAAVRLQTSRATADLTREPSRRLVSG